MKEKKKKTWHVQSGALQKTAGKEKKKKRRRINTVSGCKTGRQVGEREAKITGGWRLCGEGFEYNHAHADHKLECTQVTGGSRESARPFVRVFYFDSHLGRLPVSSKVPFGCRLCWRVKVASSMPHPSFSIGGGTAYNNEETEFI